MPEFSGEITHVEVAGVPLWLIALLPFIGSAINAVFGRRFQKSGWQAGLQKKLHIGSAAVTAVAVAAMLGAFVLAAISFAQLVSLDGGHRYLHTYGWQMLRIGSLDINFSLAMDPLSGIMTLIITGVGT
ncbi:MAG TPA: NADH-quinone oxidoreductase subunit L, partial [Sorangium sp.]|nr:NADH-quinone oxidoreductase subunit L [Sorangium sp.]